MVYKSGQFFSTVLSQSTRVTDGQTDRRTDGQTGRMLIARPRLHSMQRGKNEIVAHTLTSHATYLQQGWKGRQKEGRERDPEWE